MPKTVLIVEDNALNMKMMNDQLQANGHKTIQSIDGSDVMVLVKEHRPDLIVMDIQLPGISGLELTQMLKADDELKHIPVIAVTALAMKGDEQKLLEAGCDVYVAKPISVAGFQATVSNI
ncbi:MAG: response regulator [Rhodospirillales bacterium]